LGIGDWAQSPIPNPQSPIPNPQSPKYEFYFSKKINVNEKYIEKK
jgi:cbb3-type cytochrome oxidase cytochrome c subunit